MITEIGIIISKKLIYFSMPYPFTPKNTQSIGGITKQEK